MTPHRHLATLLLATQMALSGSTHADEPVVAPRAVPERERIAVLIVADQDARLSDNLTEVAIATVADVTRADFVGLAELRGQLVGAGIVKTGGLSACLEIRECRLHVVEAAGASRALSGRVDETTSGRMLRLTLTSADGAENEAAIAVSPALTELIAAVQAGVRRLLLVTERRSTEPSRDASKPQLSAPKIAPSFAAPDADRKSSDRPARGTPSARLLLPPPRVPDIPRARTHSPPVLGFILGGASVSALSAGTITLLLAAGPPQGHTRAEAQADLEHRATEKSVAAGLLIGGAALAVASAVVLVLH